MARWPELLRRAQRLVGADATIQLTVDAAPEVLRRAEVLEQSHVLELSAGAAAHYADLTPTSPIALPVARLAPGAFTPVHALLPRRVFERTHFAEAWVRPNRMHDALIGPITPMGSTMTVLNFLRESGAGPRCYEEEDAAAWSCLAHLARAFRLNARLASAGLQADGLAADMLDTVAAGLVGFDAAGRVLWTNAAAERLLAEADGLALDRDRRLVVSRGADAAALARLLRATAAGRGAAMSVERPSGGLALCLTATPLSQARSDGARSIVGERGVPVGVLAVHAPGEALEPAQGEALQARLRALYGLTRAEAAVAVRLARHGGLMATADALGVSHATVHTHARRVYQKMDARGQSDLSRRVEALRLLDGATADPWRAG